MDDTFPKEILSILLLRKEDQEYNSEAEYDCGILPKQSFAFDPFALAGILTSLFDYCINLVPENIQNEFEEATLNFFDEMIELRHGHIQSLEDYLKEND